MERDPDVNVAGGSLLPCSADPVTGFYRDGCCATGPEDVGSHTMNHHPGSSCWAQSAPAAAGEYSPAPLGKFAPSLAH